MAGELALARVDVAIVKRRESHDLAGLRAGGLHKRTLEVLDQRGIAVLRGQAENGHSVNLAREHPLIVLIVPVK